MMKVRNVIYDRPIVFGAFLAVQLFIVVELFLLTDPAYELSQLKIVMICLAFGAAMGFARHRKLISKKHSQTVHGEEN